MKRLFSIATAVILTIGVTAASISTANAGKRERRILAGAAIGIGAALLINHAERKARKRRRAREYYRTYERPYRRHRNDYRYRDHDRYYNEPEVVYDPPRRHYRDAPRRVYHEAPRRRYRQARRISRNSHIGWCHNRYRSYRSSDNTFQPYHGRRTQCISPYN